MIRQTPNHLKRKSTRVQRACFNCRKRKQGCEDERPCRRCVEKGIKCVEVESKRKRGRVRAGEGDSDANLYDPIDESPEEYSSASEMGVEEEPESCIEDVEEEEPVKKEVKKIPEQTEVSSPTPPPKTSSPLSSPQESESEQDIEPPPVPTKNTKASKVNLALLLPFLGHDSMVGNHVSCHHQHEEESYEKCLIDVGECSNAFLCGLDFPFYTQLNHTAMGEDQDTQVIKYLRECWNQFLSTGEEENLKKELNKGIEKWREILESLRSLQWQKVHSHLREMDPIVNCIASEFSPMGEELDPAIVFWSPGGRIHYANPPFCKMVGHSMDELRVDAHGQEKIRAHSLFHPEEMVKILTKQLDAVQHPDNSNYHMRTRLITKFHQEVPVHCYISNLRDPLGMHLLTVACFVSS